MITTKTAEDIVHLREGGKRLGAVLARVAGHIAPGVSTEELDDMAEELIREGGDTPAFLGYQPVGADRPFPASLCVSVNDEIVHGIPNEDSKILREGDLVGIDLGLIHEGLIVDAALTVPVGEVDDVARRLLHSTKEALAAGIKAARPGSTIGDIGHAIDSVARSSGFGSVREFGGHGVGYQVHEEPMIPNQGKPGTGPALEPGMVLALEPMLNEGTGAIDMLDDGYTIVTKDGKRSAHFEHTILITEKGADILTQAGQ